MSHRERSHGRRIGRYLHGYGDGRRRPWLRRARGGWGDRPAHDQPEAGAGVRGGRLRLVWTPGGNCDGHPWPGRGRRGAVVVSAPRGAAPRAGGRPLPPAAGLPGAGAGRRGTTAAHRGAHGTAHPQGTAAGGEGRPVVGDEGELPALHRARHLHRRRLGGAVDGHGRDGRVLHGRRDDLGGDRCQRVHRLRPPVLPLPPPRPDLHGDHRRHRRRPGHGPGDPRRLHLQPLRGLRRRCRADPRRRRVRARRQPILGLTWSCANLQESARGTHPAKRGGAIAQLVRAHP
ncbi:hypothetical protein SGPA1_50279 [Streptomyces misionensis JCM 4497]